MNIIYKALFTDGYYTEIKKDEKGYYSLVGKLKKFNCLESLSAYYKGKIKQLVLIKTF